MANIIEANRKRKKPDSDEGDEQQQMASLNAMRKRKTPTAKGSNSDEGDEQQQEASLKRTQEPAKRRKTTPAAQGSNSAEDDEQQQKANKVLQTLNVGANKIGDQGAAAFAEALKENKECKLEKLDVSLNPIGAEGAQRIAKATRGPG
eukprot:g42429.t1